MKKVVMSLAVVLALAACSSDDEAPMPEAQPAFETKVAPAPAPAPAPMAAPQAAPAQPEPNVFNERNAK